MDIDFEDSPFSGFVGFTNGELEDLWKYLFTKNSTLPKEFEVHQKNETSNGIKIFVSKNEIFDEIEFYENGIDIFKDDKLLTKIYCIKQLTMIVSILSKNDKYDFKVESNESNINSKNGQIIKIKINSKIILEDKNFKNYIKRERLFNFDEEIKEEKVLEIEKLKMSPYFNNIINCSQNDDKFNFIIDENRFKLFKKIEEFWISNDFFYVIMGTDGIGKTTSLLFFSSYMHKDYNVLYLNLKLFSKKNSKEAEDIFFNEMIRAFFVSDFFLTSRILDERYVQFQKLKSSIIKEVEAENKNKEANGIEFMWLLLQIFIKNIFNSDILSTNILIILDQYKNNGIDKNYRRINEISDLIGDLIGINIKLNDLLVIYKIKLLVIISINNYDTKKMFLENLNIIYLDYNKKIISDIHNNKDINNIKENENYELLNIENFLNKKVIEINKSFNDRLSILGNNSIENSLCLINTKYCHKTRKEYLNINSDCKKLITENFGNNYYQCLKKFNFSLKYFQLLMKEKIENPKNQDESDDEYEKRIVKSFYNKMFKKIKDKIDKSYKYMIKEDSTIESVDISLKYLIELRNNIYEEKTFLITDIENILNRLPIKYLDVYLDSSQKLDQYQIKFGFFDFYISYSNTFIKQAINKIINGYLKNKKYINFDGIGFEKIVNEHILKFTFHNQKLIKRNIFSLVGITESTKDYIKKLRDKESSEFYEFYELEKIKNLFIDGIDKIKIETSDIDVKNNNIFLNQVSKNGRSFDAGLLIKKDNKFNKSVTNDLILIQDTINKVINLKKKEIYINDSIKTKDYLESVYEGLKIDKIYFIFIIPDHYTTIDKTKHLLDKYQIYYLNYSLEKMVIINTKGDVITDFRIKEADITFPNNNFSLIKTISDINLSKNIMKESTKKYLMKRKNTDKTFIDIYNKFCQIYSHECKKVFIPKKLKENIIKIFISLDLIKNTDTINFIPSSNYIGTEIETIFNTTNNMIIFSYENKVYLYYFYYFKIDDKLEIIKIDNLNINNSNNTKSPKKNLSEFNKIKKYPLFYFCFNIIKNYNFENYNFEDDNYN